METEKGHIKTAKTIILTALGGVAVNALYDIFFKNLIYITGSVFVKFFSFIYSGYLDRLYSRIGAQTDLLLIFPSIVILVSIFLSCFYVGLFFIGKFKFNKLELVKRQILIFNTENGILTLYYSTKFLVVALFFLSFIYVEMTIRLTVNHLAINSIKWRLDVIRPYISQEYSYKLLSEFRLVDNRFKLQNLVTKIEDVGKKNNIELPEFRLYGIKSKYSKQ